MKIKMKKVIRINVCQWLIILLVSFGFVSNTKSSELSDNGAYALIGIGTLYYIGDYLWGIYKDKKRDAELEKRSAVLEKQNAEKRRKDQALKQKQQGEADKLHAGLLTKHKKKVRTRGYSSKFNKNLEQKRLDWLKGKKLSVYELSVSSHFDKMRDEDQDFKRWYKYQQMVAEHEKRIKNKTYPDKYYQALEKKRLEWLSDQNLWMLEQKRSVHLKDMREDRKFVKWENRAEKKGFKRMKKTNSVLRYISGLKNSNRTFNKVGKKSYGSLYTRVNFPSIHPVKLSYGLDGKLDTLYFKSEKRGKLGEAGMMSGYICNVLFQKFKGKQRPDYVILNSITGGADCNRAAVGSAFTNGSVRIK